LRDVSQSGDFLYLALEGDVAIYDVRIPGAPIEVSSVPVGLAAYQVLVRNGYLFVATDARLRVLDVGDPRLPVVVASLPINPATTDIAYTGARLILVQPSGLRVIDVADTSRPRDLGERPGRFLAVEAVDGLVYAAGPAAVQIYAVADMPGGAPIGVVGESEIGEGRAISVSGARAFVLAGAYALRVIDVADPRRPRVVGGLNLPWYATGVRAVGERLVAFDPWGLGVVDVSNPTEPRARGRISLDPWPARRIRGARWSAVTGTGDHVVHASSDTGASLVAISDPMRPQMQAWIAIQPQLGAWDLAVDGNEAYLADVSSDGLLHVDVSDPSSPVIAERLAAELGQGVLVASNRARFFAAVWRGSCPCGGALLELGRGAAPTIRASLPVTWTPAALTAADGRMYASFSGEDDDLVIFDAPDTGGITEVGRYRDANYIRDILVSGTTAFVADMVQGLLAFDVSVPASPRVVGRLPLPGRALRVALTDGYAFLAVDDGVSGRKSLIVADVADPSAPRAIKVLEAPAGELATNGRCLYVGGGDRLQAYDIATPSDPVLLDEVRLPDLSQGLAVARDVLYVTSYEVGLIGLRHVCPGPAVAPTETATAPVSPSASPTSPSTTAPPRQPLYLPALARSALDRSDPASRLRRTR